MYKTSTDNFYLQINNKSNQCYCTCCIYSGEDTCHSGHLFILYTFSCGLFKKDEDPIDTSIDIPIEPAQEPEDTQGSQ